MLPSNYHEMSENDQAAHWIGYIYRGMRSAGEEGYDEISILDRKELGKWKALDPQLENLLPKILEILADMWQVPKEAFFQRVNDQMGTDFSRPTEEQPIPRRK